MTASTAFKRFASVLTGSAIGQSIISEYSPTKQLRASIEPDSEWHERTLIIEGKSCGQGQWTARISTDLKTGALRYPTEDIIKKPVTTSEMLRTMDGLFDSAISNINSEQQAEYLQQIRQPLLHILQSKGLAAVPAP